jgi:CRP/FNR family transcriptional regulator, cyclic AMP receptor protein
MRWELMAGLPEEDVRQLLAIARRRVFRRGEVVFHRDRYRARPIADR